MFKPSEIYKNPFKYLFFLLIILYIVVYYPYGFEDGDMGYTLGISWSMYNGLFPHVDFVDIKPSFSPYFHSWFFYISEEYAYMFSRAFYYVQVFVYSWLAARLLCKTFEIKSGNICYFIAIVGALISIHNYPPMPWNTIDGLFFTSIGVTFLFSKRPRIIYLALGALFVSLGVLCKQSFFFVPVFITLYLLWRREWRKVIAFLAFGLITAAGFVGVLWSNDALVPFYDQITSFTSGGSLLDTGVKTYYLALKFNVLWAIPVAALFLVLRRYLPGNPVYVLLNLLIAGIFISLYLQDDSFLSVKRFLLQLLFIASAGYALIMTMKNKKYGFLLLMLSFAWCASISNGFNTPIDYATPIVFSLFVWCYDVQDFAFRKSVGLFTVGLFLITFYIGYQTVYRDSPRSELTYSLSEVFPRFKGIKSDEETYEKYAELKELATKYDNFTMLPSVTLGHYLTNTVNPIGVDWVLNHHLADQLPDYIKKLEDQNVTVFMENYEDMDENYEEDSLLTTYVRDHWKLVEKGEHFRVFQKL